MHSIRLVLVVGFATLLAFLPAAHADEGDVVVRAKRGPDLERMAQVLLGDDAKAASALSQKIKALTPAQIERLMGHVRRLARAANTTPGAKQSADDARALVTISTHVLEAPRNFLHNFDVASKPVGRPTAKQPVRYLDATALDVILRAMKKSDTIQLTSAPRLTAYDRQRANVQVIHQVSYVQDYEVEVGMGGASLADPIIGIVQEGVVLDITPTVSTDGKFISVEFHGTWSSLKRPIEDMELTLGGHKVTIQLPEVVTSKVKLTTTMPDGSAALIGGGELIERDGVAYQRLVLLQVTKTDMNAIKKSEGDKK